MGYIREAKKAGLYEARFITPKEVRDAIRNRRGEKWEPIDGEGVRFAFSSIPLPEVQIEPIPETPVSQDK